MLADENAAETLGSSEPVRRRAYWPIALLLGGLVVAMLGAAFVLDQQFRSRVGVEPAAPIAGVAVQPYAVAPTIASAPHAAPTATAVPTAAAAPTSAPTAVATIAPPTSSIAAPAAAVASPLPKNAADLLSPLQKEVVDAYLRYWAVRTRAYYDLDSVRLREVLAGPELARDEEDIRKLREQGRAADLDVDLNFRILRATPDEATVYDEYVNRSVHLDAVTKQVLPTKEPPTVLKISFEMKKIEGVWKVVDVARHG
jgi:hypothetical protein